jgi:hypothetical protein
MAESAAELTSPSLTMKKTILMLECDHKDSPGTSSASLKSFSLHNAPRQEGLDREAAFVSAASPTCSSAKQHPQHASLA